MALEVAIFKVFCSKIDYFGFNFSSFGSVLQVLVLISISGIPVNPKTWLRKVASSKIQPMECLSR